MLRLLFAPVLHAQRIPAHELAIFRQAHAGAPFELTQRVGLGVACPSGAERVDPTDVRESII